MYNNLIYFILVLLIFTTYQPSKELLLPGWAGLVLGLVLFAAYQGLARAWFRRLRQNVTERMGAKSGSLQYYRFQTSLSILALVLYTFDIYFLGFKEIILTLPLAGRFSALTGLAGLLVFAVYMVILWGEAFAAYSAIYPSRLNRSRFVWSQLRFNLPIILPWLLLSLAADLIALLPWAFLKKWLESPAGEIGFFVVFMIVLVVFFPALIRPLWGLRPMPDGPQRRDIEDFCRRHGFRVREIMLWPLYEGEGLTAGVMGLVRRWRFLLITPALLKILDQDELAGVIGHEFGHVKRHHLLFYVLFFLGYLVLAYSFFDLHIYLLLASNWAMDLLLPHPGGPGTLWSILLTVPAVILMIVYFRYIFGVFMRNFERQADLFAFRLTGTIKGLISSLEKIAFYSGQSRNVPSWHHFSVAQRVDYLDKAGKNPALVKGHDRKVRFMIAAYCLGLVLVAWAGFHVHRSGLSEGINRQMAVNLLDAEIKRHPERALAHRLLGDVYIQAGETDQAIAAYERAVQLAPDDAETLNNLAWAFATKKGASAEEKARALDLAYRAAALKPSHYILDTLAEALYINGRPKKALEIINEALGLAQTPQDRSYLLKQKDKFEAAVDQSDPKPAP